MDEIGKLVELERTLDAVFFGDVRKQVRETTKSILDYSWWTGQKPKIVPPIYNHDYGKNVSRYAKEVSRIQPVAERYHRRFIAPHHAKRNRDLVEVFEGMIKRRHDRGR